MLRTLSRLARPTFCAIALAALAAGCGDTSKPAGSRRARIRRRPQRPPGRRRAGHHGGARAAIPYRRPGARDRVRRNTTDKPISIVSEGRDLVRVKLYRTFGVGWELLKEYPALALPVRSEWQLPPHGQRVFQLTVPVEPNWPTAENILLRAVLNNGPEAEPGVLVDIEPQLPKIGEKTAPKIAHAH